MFYARLKTLCEENHSTISEVAQNNLGVGNSTATAWKKGACPRSDVVVKAADYFHVSTDYLLGRTNDPTPYDNGLTEQEIDLLGAYRAADPKLKAAALAVLTSAPPRYMDAKLSTSQSSDLPEAL